MPDGSRGFAVTSQAKPLSDAELEAYEAQRDLGAELLQAIREMKDGQGRVVYSESAPAKPRPKPTVEEIMAIAHHCASLRVLDDRSADEIIGYDENGIPR
ncbi:hypothetical protein [Methylomagnum sp.]